MRVWIPWRQWNLLSGRQIAISTDRNLWVFAFQNLWKKCQVIQLSLKVIQCIWRKSQLLLQSALEDTFKMKLHTRPFMFCGLLLIFTLTSCSSSPSIEDQTKLIEHENCLALARERHKSANEDFNRGIISLEEAQERNLYAYPEKYCEDKRP